MIDSEKVIEGLEAIREFFGFGLPSQSPVFETYQRILIDALAILKEQEAVEPVNSLSPAWGNIYFCGKCGYPVGKHNNYCSECGKKVKWE